ncbi:MAG TPA: DMT family transporter [Rickettsia endosymbiont of Sericostoma sp.]|uniref:DMT family transporter n=1 Tax=Candidatus Tisiphia endosymbiont of Nemotelus uliginosus TaxID=3077926 RepID=UPI001D4B8775|nr:DMT family transporter [Rickettsia endosymbiont of Sericostoma sp.]
MKATLYILSAFGLGAMKASIIKSLNNSVPISLVVFSQFFLCTIYFLPKVIKSHGRLIVSQHYWALISRGLLGIGYWYCMFSSVNYLSLFNVSVLSSLSPFWVLLITGIFIDKSINKELFVLAIIGFIGCLLILKPSREIINLGAIFGLFSGIFMALTLISIKNLLKTENSDRVLVYYFGIASLSMLPFLMNFAITQVSLNDWVLLSINALLMLLHQILLNKGLEIGLVTETSILAYSSVLFSLILSIVIWQEIPDIFSIVGAIIIISSGIYIAKRQKS